MKRTYIGQYRIDTLVDDFFGTGVCKYIYKWSNDGWHRIAIYMNGNMTYYGTFMRNGCDLTRAKGYRYWEKYFKDKYVWQLPIELQNAVNMECESIGVFYSKKRKEYICYAG